MREMAESERGKEAMCRGFTSPWNARTAGSEAWRVSPDRPTKNCREIADTRIAILCGFTGTLRYTALQHGGVLITREVNRVCQLQVWAKFFADDLKENRYSPRSTRRCNEAE